MPITRQATRPDDRVRYTTNFCRRSWQAMNTIRDRFESLSGITYSHSVISRALALQAQYPGSIPKDWELLKLCRECASKRKKKEPNQ